MIDGLKQILESDWRTIILALFLFFFTFRQVAELITWVVHWLTNLFGWETKWAREERERKALIERHECKFQNIDAVLQKMQKQREQDVMDSKEHDRKIEEKVSNISDILLDEQIDTKRNRILNFANALQNGKHQDKEQFDFIFLQYDKYEKILKTHKLENGQVTASMDFIKQTYQEKLKTGF